MSMHYEDDDLEPFLSEIQDEAFPPRWRLGSLLVIQISHDSSISN